MRRLQQNLKRRSSAAAAGTSQVSRKCGSYLSAEALFRGLQERAILRGLQWKQVLDWCETFLNPRFQAYFTRQERSWIYSFILVMGKLLDNLSGLEYRQEINPSLRRSRHSLSMYAGTGSCRARLSAAATTTTTRLVSVVALLWAVGWVGTASGVRNLDMEMESELVETETGWQFVDDDIEPFDNATAPAPAPAAAKVSSGVIPLINGDFELTNVTGNATVLADSTSTAVINWLPGGAGVQVLFGITYQMPPKTPKSLYCIHLNNPAATGNGTQGSLSTTLAAAAATGKTYTVQYDTARMPDGPINLWSALKVSAVEGGTVNSWVVKNPVYNATDAASHITWQKQSFVYTGTGSQTVIKFESMSEKYGPIIDNVQILSGKHELAAATLGKMAGDCQRSVPLLTLLALLMFQPQLQL